MTVDEAEEVFARLVAAYPSAKVGEDTVEVWVEDSADLDYDDALQAVRDLRQNEEWFPSIARFREVTMSVTRARVTSRLALTEGSSRITPADEGKARIAELRKLIRDAVKTVDEVTS